MSSPRPPGHSVVSIQAQGIHLSIGVRHVLVDAALALDPGHRVGIVGPNGVGKSTLLRIVAGEVVPDRGTVVRRPATCTVGYLRQEPERRAETARGFIGRRTGVDGAQAVLDRATTALAEGVVGADDHYSDALERWLSLGAADLDSRIGTVFDDLGLDERLLSQGMSTLSGGEAARVGLAALLLSRFDVLLLDEPTNDLDIASLERLETFVNGVSAPVALVSHDRTFLQRTITDVVEIDEFTRATTRFAGGWDAYLHERDVARAHAQQRYDEYVDKSESLAARAQREREWATQGLAKAKKKPDDGDKFVRAFKVNQTEQLAGRAARTQRAMERLEVVDEPRTAWELRLELKVAPRSGDVVADVSSATVTHGSFTLGPVDLHIGYGERVVVVGPNGSGKSTLISLITGDREPTSGNVRRGSSVVVGRVDQMRGVLRADAELLAEFLAATGMTVSEARTLLAKFGIGANHVARQVSTLSPGERTRVLLALLMARGTNCLVLDEPSNHLDLAAIEQVEHALESFPGTVLLVSHDRTMLERFRRTRTIEMAGGQVVADTPA